VVCFEFEFDMKHTSSKQTIQIQKIEFKTIQFKFLVQIQIKLVQQTCIHLNLYASCKIEIQNKPLNLKGFLFRSAAS